MPASHRYQVIATCCRWYLPAEIALLALARTQQNAAHQCRVESSFSSTSNSPSCFSYLSTSLPLFAKPTRSLELLLKTMLPKHTTLFDWFQLMDWFFPLLQIQQTTVNNCLKQRERERKLGLLFRRLLVAAGSFLKWEFLKDRRVAQSLFGWPHKKQPAQGSKFTSLSIDFSSKLESRTSGWTPSDCQVTSANSAIAASSRTWERSLSAIYQNALVFVPARWVFILTGISQAS